MRLEIGIEVKSADVTQKTVKGKDGKEYVIREQSGWVDLGKAYPQEIRLPLERDAQPYEPGTYSLDPACLYVERFGRLALGRVRLTARKR